jgi:hypothetical protein|nr:MAG TPA: dehydrogenase accessory protein [Caudoviricetes sp.]
MITNRKKFKELKREGRGSLNFLFLYSPGILKYTTSDIKVGAQLQIYVLKNGVFADVILSSKKIYIDFNSILNASIQGNRLILDFAEEEGKEQIVFEIKSEKKMKKIANAIRKECKLGYDSIEDKGVYCPKCNNSNITYIGDEYSGNLRCLNCGYSWKLKYKKKK